MVIPPLVRCRFTIRLVRRAASDVVVKAERCVTARHDSASVDWGGNSGSKCASALATAFKIPATN